jgi:predicted nucleic acid-binding protein
MQRVGFSLGGGRNMQKGLVDSMTVMDYDNAFEDAIEWWERQLEDGWELHISQVSLMEMLKGIAKSPGSREEAFNDFRFRIQEMRKEGKIRRIWPITQGISKIAHSLLEQYCRRFTPPSRCERMESLICDMLIAATALKHGLFLFTKNLRDFQWIDSLRVEKVDYEIEGGGEMT